MYLIKTKYPLSLLSILLFMLVSSIAFSQSLTASVSRNPVGVNEQFQLTYSLNASGSSFKSPSLSDFMVLSGPNQSTSMQFINGNMSHSVSMSFILQPRKEGTFKIEGASIESGGKTIAAPPVTITVVKGSGNPQGGSQQGDEKTNISTNNIFIRVSVDKTNVFRGEAVVATYKLYTNVPVINYSINKVPAFNGFWSQDIQMPSQLELTNETVNGINYQVGQIKKVVLFPQQSGTLVLDPMEGECIARIQVKRNKTGSPFDIFNDPFFNDPFFSSGGVRNVRFAVKSEPVKINVKELPPNPPPSFNGAVGRFSFEGNIDKSSTSANDPVNLRLKVTGQGNIKLVESPMVEIPPDIENYDPKITDNITTSIRGTSGTRTFEYLLIPRHEGSYSLGPVEFSYFDLDKKAYVTLKSPQLALNVKRGSGTTGSYTGAAREEFQVLGRDIRFIKTASDGFKTGNDTFFGSLLFWLIIVLPIAGFIALFLFRKKYESDLSDLSQVKSRKATRMARKRLSIASNHLKSNNKEQFYEEISKALLGYAADKLKIPTAGLSRETIVNALKKAGAGEESTALFITTLDQCEYSRFARMEDARQPEEIYRDAINIITKVEDEIRG